MNDKLEAAIKNLAERAGDSKDAAAALAFSQAAKELALIHWGESFKKFAESELLDVLKAIETARRR